MNTKIYGALRLCHSCFRTVCSLPCPFFVFIPYQNACLKAKKRVSAKLMTAFLHLIVLKVFLQKSHSLFGTASNAVDFCVHSLYYPLPQPISYVYRNLAGSWPVA